MNRPTPRGAWEGLRKRVEFRSEVYATAAVASIVGRLATRAFRAFGWEKAAKAQSLLTSATSFWTVSSLAAASWIHDRSPLHRWTWLPDALGQLRPTRAANVHAGFDETSTALKEHLPETEWTILDFFDSAALKSASLQKARRLYPPPEEQKLTHLHQWPIRDGEFDAVFFLLSAHYLKKRESRRALLSEAKRSLGESGRVILVDHLRDVANGLAFGPGCLTFPREEAWLADFAAVGLVERRFFRLTPFLGVFVLQKEA
ncbi:MAG: class I SAM-dependent methyltransferase [Verrucomicrobiota bacterium]